MSRPTPLTNGPSATTSVPLVVAVTVLVSVVSAGVSLPVALAGGVGCLLLSVLAVAVTPT